MSFDPRRVFLALLAPLLIFRLWFAATLPFTGDEAYFVWWGRVPDWGFYDHPPMVGWWMLAQLQLDDAAWWLRLGSVIQPFVLAAAILWFMPRIWPQASREAHWWAALLTLLAPLAVWNVLITTDTPLTYFSVLSGLCWLRARRDGDLRWYLASGILLAGAVLSKYFVAFLGFAYLIDTLHRPARRKLAGLAIVYACCVPALALMAWWNAGHCWPNYMFNFVNRHGNAGLSWKTPLLYGLMLVYALTPAVLWAVLRRGKPAAPGSAADAADGSLAKLAFVPLALFALLSLVKPVGLHWILSFLPFAFIWFALRAGPPSVPRAGLFMAAFAALHAVLIVVLSLIPLDTWRNMRWYDSLVVAVDARQIVDRLRPYAEDYHFATNSYSDAVALGYHARRHFSVFGEGTSHARHDDILTDFRALDGRDILILNKSAPLMADYAPYFRMVEVKTFTLRGIEFSAVLGRGFDYPRYRDGVLAPVRRKFYALPGWLPQCGCYFCDRYFPGQTCRR